MDNVITDETFDQKNYTLQSLAKGEYENCHFNNCDFSTAGISGIKFIDCTFTGCNLSNGNVSGTALRGIKFISCKMLGLRFDTCDKFGLDINVDSCVLNYSTFFQAKLIKTSFKNSTLHEVDFTEADLTQSIFDNCDLLGARFENTIIEKANFRTAYNYSINLEINRIKKAKFSHAGIAGLLDKYDIIID